MIVDLPPPEYSGAYQGALIEIVDTRAVHQRCPPGALACAFVLGPKACLVILPHDLAGELLEQLRAHELGHCNGWGADHPNPRRAAPGTP